jgi:hypothetical protein
MRTSRLALDRIVILSCLGLCLLSSSCATDESSGDIVIGAESQIVVYSSRDDSTALRDSRLRESVPSQRQGAFGQVKCGDESGFDLDYIAMDSSVSHLDSIPRGSEIMACTLWVKLGTLSDNNNDSVVLDLWSITENWNEDEVTWESRMAGNLWQTAGGGGRLFVAALIRIKRISLTAFEWRISGEVYDTLTLQDAVAVPIPIDSSLAQENLVGSSFGFALRKNSATSSNAKFSFVTNDNLQEVNRPYIVWVYR